MASDGQCYEAKDSISKYGYADVRSKHLKVYKRRWLVLYRGISSHHAALVKYKDEEHFKNSKQRAKYLVPNFLNVGRLAEDKKKYGVVIHQTEEREGGTDMLSMQFCCSSDTEADDWVDCIIAEMNLRSIIDEFPVYLVQNELINAAGEMVMRVRDRWVSLLDSNKRIIIEWNLSRIRRYKEENTNTFWIECGRSSDTGEGRLIFTSTSAHRILQKIHEEAIKMAKTNPSAHYHDPKSLLRHPPQSENPVFKRTFTSEPDIRKPEYFQIEPESGAHNSWKVNVSDEWPRDSGYIDMLSDHPPKKIVRSLTLPPPPIVEESRKKTPLSPYRHRLEHAQSFPNYTSTSENPVHHHVTQLMQSGEETENSHLLVNNPHLASPWLDDIPENGSHSDDPFIDNCGAPDLPKRHLKFKEESSGGS